MRILRLANKLSTFDLQLPSGNKITISAEGEEEDLAFFKKKAKNFFEENNAEHKRHKNQVLTEDQVRAIKIARRDKGWGRIRLSRKFKVSKSTIERIITGKSWKDIKI